MAITRKLKGRAIFFTYNELDELYWIVPQFKNTNEEAYDSGEKELVNSIIKKIEKAKQLRGGN